MTAMGSVGEISDPKTRQAKNEISNPSQLNSSQLSQPTRKVEINRPIVAKEAMVPFRRTKYSRSTCRAPAKSRNPSMPCIRASLKSMPPITCWIWLTISRRGKIQCSPMMPRELARLIISSPTVGSSFSHR